MPTIIKRPLQNGDVSHVVRFRLGAQRRDLFLPAAYRPSHVVEISINVERLARLVKTGADLDRRTEAFLAEASDDLKERLARVGLLERRERYTLGELWDAYIDDDAGKKISTLKTYETVRKRFFRFFDPAGDPRQVTREQLLKWLDALRAEGYAAASVAGCVQRGKAVFAWAIARGQLTANPFDGIKRGSFVNPTKRVYIPIEWYNRLLDACPSQSWRTLLALCRIGGLRNPSETLLVRWTDVDWAGGRLAVTSPKTEGHEGKGSRVIPLFPELRRELEASFDVAGPDCPYIVDHARGSATNLRTGLQRIAFHAGLEVWPDLFQNLRRSADIDISSRFPAHVASAWLGHSPRVSSEHYLFPTAADYAKANATAVDVPKTVHRAVTKTRPN